MPTLNLEKNSGAFVIRPWEEGDETSLVRYANNYEIWRNVSNRFPHPYELEHARSFIASHGQSVEGEIGGAIVVEGEAVGGIGYRLLSDTSGRTAELGYWLGESFWGRGIMTEAVRLLTAYAIGQHDLLRMQAIVYGWNPASGRVLEKAGYELEGRLRDAVYKDGEICDQLIYGKVVS